MNYQSERDKAAEEYATDQWPKETAWVQWRDEKKAVIAGADWSRAYMLERLGKVREAATFPEKNNPWALKIIAILDELEKQ